MMLAYAQFTQMLWAWWCVVVSILATRGTFLFSILGEFTILSDFWWYIVLPIYRGHYIVYISWKTPHSSPVRARHAVSFVSANLTEVFFCNYCALCTIVQYITATHRESLNKSNPIQSNLQYFTRSSNVLLYEIFCYPCFETFFIKMGIDCWKFSFHSLAPLMLHELRPISVLAHDLLLIAPMQPVVESFSGCGLWQVPFS